VITASYEDRGAGGMPSLSASQTVVLRAPVLTGGDAWDLTGGIRKSVVPTGGQVLENIHHGSSALFKQVDLTGVGKIDFSVVEMEAFKGGKMEVYLDSPSGRKLGTIDFNKAPKVEVMKGIYRRPSSLVIDPIQGRQNLLLRFSNAQAGENDNLFLFTRMVLNE